MTEATPPDPWTPAKATERLRQYAESDDFELILTDHARDQMADREITSIDIMYVLKNGFVYDPAEAATRVGLYKYKMHNPTPNSNRRDVRVVVIPSPQRAQIKIATVMWADEPMIGG